MREKVKLDIESGPLAGEKIDFNEAGLLVCGIASDCHIRFPGEDGTMSRHHFVMGIQPPRVTVRDLGSLNGTYVNDELIGRRERHETPEEGAMREFATIDLRNGDEIRAGQSVLRVAIEQPVFCPQCGKPIEGVSVGEYQSWPDPRCPGCRARAAEREKAERESPPVTGPSLDSSQEPLAELIKSMVEGRGFERRRPDEAPRIPGYKIGPMIDKGGMGAVYLAEQLSDGRRVAVKVMLADHAPNTKAAKLFRSEVEVQKALIGHPHCVALLDSDLEGRSIYFVMEYCPGGSINGLMQRRGGKLPLDEAGRLILESLDGLVFAHSRNIVHRDLKPHNVLLTAQDGGTAKLADFGLSKDFVDAGIRDITKTGDVGGNPLGMPREQVIDYKRVKPVSDVWGMAATFYNMLTGAMVRNFGFGRDPINVILSEPAVPIRDRDSQVSRSLAAVVDRALSDDVDERYQTAAEFKDALIEVM